MKKLILKSVAASVIALTTAVVSFAQTKEVNHDLSEFNGVSASSEFKVSVVSTNYSETSQYGAKITVDEKLADYVDCYVKGGVLYVGLRDKDIPKDVKKSYKVKNAIAPVLRVVAYSPKINSISLADDATFSSDAGLDGNVTLELTGSSSIQSLTVKGGSLNIKADKKSSVVVMAKSDNVVISSDGDASIRVDCSGTKKLEVRNGGSANVNVNGEFEEAEIDADKSSQLTISGSTQKLTITGSGNKAKVDASAFSTPEASIQTAGPETLVSVANTLELSLGKGSSVTYTGDPTISIVKVESASIYRK